jgi:peptide/nickel transport system ATP-binding protein
MSSTEAILSIENLRVEYFSDSGRKCVVDDVSFKIHPGEVFGLAGESGSGKSTVAQAVLRVLRQPAVITAGRIMLNGRDVLDMDSPTLRKVRWREVAMVTQSAMNALNPVTTVEAQITDVLEVHEGITGKKATARARELLDLVGIDSSRLRAYPHELSGGMRQRVVIAIALALTPKLLIMDEPTTALDVIVEREILGQIGDLRRELGFSVLFISHDLGLMRHICTHLGILYKGQLVESNRAAEIFARPQHEYTQHLFNSMPMLHAPGSRHSAGSGHASSHGGNGVHSRGVEAADKIKTAAADSLYSGDQTIRAQGPHD